MSFCNWIHTTVGSAMTPERERERERERDRSSSSSSSSLKWSDRTEVSTLALIKKTMVKEQQQKDKNAFIQQFAAG
jgi:hypothetical protein